jgi:hypothetical protein
MTNLFYGNDNLLFFRGKTLQEITFLDRVWCNLLSPELGTEFIPFTLSLKPDVFSERILSLPRARSRSRRIQSEPSHCFQFFVLRHDNNNFVRPT